MSIQSEQFAKNGLKKLLLIAGSGAFACSAAALLTYGHLQARSYRQERSQWVALQGSAASKDYESCRSQGDALSSSSRFYGEAQALLQQCSLGLAREKAIDQDLTQAISIALAINTADEALKEEAQALVTQWSGQVVKKGEELLQAGKLDQAIALVRELPADSPAASSIESTVQGWQKQWSQSEAVIQESVELLERGQWLAAKEKLETVASITHWQQQKKPLLERAEAGIADVARYEAEQARQQAIAAAAAARYRYEAPRSTAPSGGGETAQPRQAPVAAYAPPPVSSPQPVVSSFDNRVENLYNSYVSQGQNSWDAWIQACQASGGYVVDQGPQAGCSP